MVFSESDVSFLRKCILDYRSKSVSATDPYDMITFSVCADAFQHILDELLSYHLPSDGAIVS